MKLSSIDKVYRENLENNFECLKIVSDKIINSYEYDLNKSEISEAILERLKSFYQTQQNLKGFLNKRYQTPGSDFFVETVLFFLKLFIEKTNKSLEVHSERQIIPHRGSIRPDISIWKNDKVESIIECKTQLGWNRNNWENEFFLREQKLKKDFPKAQSYLLVMTGLNWSGFKGNKYLGEKYFCFLDDLWPTDYKNTSQLMIPIEILLKKINKY